MNQEDQQLVRSFIAQELKDFIPSMPDDQIAALVSRMSPEMWANIPTNALRKIKRAAPTRFLIAGADINTTVYGSTTVANQAGHAGPTLPDIINLASGFQAKLNARDEARQLDIKVQAGGGADCMFDVLVSDCWATEITAGRGTQTQAFTSITGCTFYVCSTVQAGLTQAGTLNTTATRSTVVYICPGVYTEDTLTLVGGVNGTVEVRGGGMDATVIRSTSASVYGFQPTTMARIIVADLTFSNNGTAATSAQVYFDVVWELRNVRFVTASGGTALRAANTINRASNVWFSGTSATLAISLDANSGDTQWENVRITGYTTAIGGAGGDDKVWNNVTIINCTTAILLTDANNWQMSNVWIETCTTGLELSTNNIITCQFTSFRLLDVTTAIDPTGAAVNITSNQFIDWELRAVTSAGTRIGVNFGDLGSRYTYCTFYHWHFHGYTSGNEFQTTGSAGTGTVGAHNTSNAGTVADFGSPYGHAAAALGAPSPHNLVSVHHDGEQDYTNILNLLGLAVSTSDLTIYSDAGITQVGQWDGATGHIGIPTISTSRVININKTLASGQARGLEVVLVGSTASGVGVIAGMDFDVTGPSSGNQNIVLGVNGVARHASSGTLALLAGYRAALESAGAGAITEAAAFIGIDALWSSDVPATTYVLKGGNQGGTGATAYGIYIPAQTGTAARSFIADLLALGTDAAAVATGVTLQTGPIGLPEAAAPGTPSADAIAIYNETNTDGLRMIDDTGAVNLLSHKHLLNVLVDGTTTTQFTEAGPMPHAGVITDVTCRTCDDVQIGATAWVGNIYKRLAADLNTTTKTSIFTVAPTITNTNYRQVYGAPDSITTFAAGDYFAFATTTAGTNATFIQMGMTVRYT